MSWKKFRSSTFALMAVIVVSKLVGMARDVVLANYFGTSAISDAYLIAVSVPTLLFYFIGHALSTAYLPMYNKIKSEEGIGAAERYSNNLMCISLVISTLLVLLLLLCPRAVIKVFAAGFDDATASVAARFIQISAVSLYFMVIINIWGGYLQANANYLIPAAISLPRNIVIILSIVIAAGTNIFFLGIGLLAAYVAEFLLLLPFVLKGGYHVRPCIAWKDRRIGETLYLVLPILLGVGVSQINKIIDKSIASTLTEGGISALTYASVLNNAIQEVAVTGIITVLFANCSALAANGEHQQVKTRLMKTLDTMVFLLVPASMGIIVLAEPVVTVFLCRGNFDQTSVLMTMSALQYYTLGLVFLAVRDALVKVFYAYKDTKVTTTSSIAAICVNIVLNIILSKFLGLGGLALATSISAVFQCVLLYCVFGKKYTKLAEKNSLIGMAQSVIWSVVMAAAVYCVYHHCLPEEMMTILKLCISVVVGVVVYVGIHLVFHRKRFISMVRWILN